MSDNMHQSRSPSVHTITPDAVAREFNNPATDHNRPDLNETMEDQDPDSFVSECESIISIDQSGNAPLPFISSGLMELSEGDEDHRYVKDRFLSRLDELVVPVTVVSIHQNCYSSVAAKARAQAFRVYLEAMQKKSGADTANVRYAWYATSKEDVPKILSYGFGYGGKPENSGLYGSGLYFAPEIHLVESVKIAPMDEDGIRHLLLCRVILGQSELVNFGSEQSHPSSEQYDSGVDDLSSPTRYIVWNTHMNTHVLPEYVISFRAPCCLRALLRTPEEPRRPTSRRASFPALISELSDILLPSDMEVILKYHKDQKRGKLSRRVLVQKVRLIIRCRLLIRFFKDT